jgi:hypothetical protein
MILPNNEKNWKRAQLLLTHGAIELYSKEISEPEEHSLLFFGEIPEELLNEREEFVARNEGARTWILISDLIGGSEWVNEMSEVYALQIIEVDNLKDAEATLRQLVQPQQKRVAGM